MGAGQSDLASSFLRLLVWRRRQLPEGLETLWPDIAGVAREVAREQDYYDAPVDIYGSFQDLVDRLDQ